MENTLTGGLAPREAALSTAAPRRASGGAEARRELWISAGAVLSFSTLVALLDASQIYLKMLDHGHSWWRIFLWQQLVWWSWAALTPAIRSMGRRYRVERCGRARFAAVHLGAAAALALVHMLPVTLATVLINPFAPMVEREYFGERYLPLLLSWLPVEVILYWMVLAVGNAVDYRRSLAERELRASQLEAQLSAAELQALKLQLHPHFLFNSLNAVAGLVRKNENEKAVRTLAGLGELLRAVLDSDGAQTVPLGRELQFVERYLEIQRCRFSDRLTCSIDLPPDLAGAAVPSLILQPIVENALEHGIARAAGPGAVRVDARAEGGRLVLSVWNSGPGPGTIERWGVGLANTHARLGELYGDRYEVRAEERGGGTAVTLAFPLSRDGEAP